MKMKPITKIQKNELVDFSLWADTTTVFEGSYVDAYLKQKEQKPQKKIEDY